LSNDTVDPQGTASTKARADSGLGTDFGLGQFIEKLLDKHEAFLRTSFEPICRSKLNTVGWISSTSG